MSESANSPLDVSVTIRPRMPIYDGNPGVSIELAQSLERGDPANVSRLELGAHTGTHVDAPRHFIADGAGGGRAAARTLRGTLRRGDATAAAARSTPRSSLRSTCRAAANACS